MTFTDIINMCEKLSPEEKIIINWGGDQNIVLYVYKDEDYNPLTKEYNLVDIHVFRFTSGGKREFVSDIVGIHVTDELYEVLEVLEDIKNEMW